VAGQELTTLTYEAAGPGGVGLHLTIAMISPYLSALQNRLSLNQLQADVRLLPVITLAQAAKTVRLSWPFDVQGSATVLTFDAEQLLDKPSGISSLVRGWYHLEHETGFCLFSPAR